MRDVRNLLCEMHIGKIIELIAFDYRDGIVHFRHKDKIYTESMDVYLLAILRRFYDITPEDVIKYVSEYFGVNIQEKTRKREILVPRQIATKILREYCNLSLSEIGKLFNQGYCTQMNSLKVIDDLIETDKQIWYDYHQILLNLKLIR